VRNLIIFIRQYFNFLLFVALEIFCLTMVLRDNNFQHTAYLNSSEAITAWIYKKYNDVQYYFKLKDTNDSLVAQNTRLLNQLAVDFDRPDTTGRTVTDTSSGRKYQYLYARVVNNSVNSPNNYITIHRGRLQNVKPDMGVISPSGVAGIVRSVSDNYAVVMSVLNRQTSISARIDSGYTGTVAWQPLQNAVHGILKDIPKSARIKKGDPVVTSGFSTLFPPGIPIGYVEKISDKGTGIFHTITIRFATNFYNLQYVYIIGDLGGNEQKTLEATETQ